MANDNITLKKQNAFVTAVTKGLLEMGAVLQPTNENMLSNKQFKLDTIAGVLNITLYNSQTFLYTVYSRFEDVEKAKDKFNCNPYSGKYNTHLSAKGNTGLNPNDNQHCVDTLPTCMPRHLYLHLHWKIRLHVPRSPHPFPIHTYRDMS